ncbi:MAG: hypothetical protein WD119_02200 [Pirellulaceae bacterium]
MKARILTIATVALLLTTTGCRGGLGGLFFGRGATCGGPEIGPQYNIGPPAMFGPEAVPGGPDCGCGPMANYSPGVGGGYPYADGGYLDGSAIGGGVIGPDGWDARSNYGFEAEQIVPGSMRTSPATPMAPVQGQ